MLLLTLLIGLSAGQEKPKSDREMLIDGARTVLASIVQAGRDNHRRATPLAGEALTALYVRAAAGAARKLPEKTASKAFLLAIGVGLDTSSLMRGNLVVGGTWRRLESD